MLSCRVLLWHTRQIGRNSCKVQIWVNHIPWLFILKRCPTSNIQETRKYLPEQYCGQSFMHPLWFDQRLRLNPTIQLLPFLAWFCQVKTENKLSLDKGLLAWLKQTAKWKATQTAEMDPIYKINPGTIRHFLLSLLQYKAQLRGGVSKPCLQYTSLSIS